MSSEGVIVLSPSSTCSVSSPAAASATKSINNKTPTTNNKFVPPPTTTASRAQAHQFLYRLQNTQKSSFKRPPAPPASSSALTSRNIQQPPRPPAATRVPTHHLLYRQHQNTQSSSSCYKRPAPALSPLTSSNVQRPPPPSAVASSKDNNTPPPPPPLKQICLTTPPNKRRNVADNYPHHPQPPPPPPSAAAAPTTTTTNLLQQRPVQFPAIPARLVHPVTKVEYVVGEYLGKGAFARCHAVVSSSCDDDEVSACKMIPQSLLKKSEIREKIYQEVIIHRSLRHEFIVGFKTYFEDDSFVFMVLELCEKRSLHELQKKRLVVTEPEAKYFLRQIVSAVDYLHGEMKVIHRDLKLGNVFITKDIRLKIGDFGLAGRIDTVGDMKRTLCGTPNYIAPEVLAKTGHSYEVDIWSVGCMLYTLLVGKPPFETSTLRDTYRKIKHAEYDKPKTHKSSRPARELIDNLLQVNPAKRPTPKDILNSEFLNTGIIPSSLPPSVLTTTPKFTHHHLHHQHSAVNSSSSSAPNVPIVEGSFLKEFQDAINTITSNLNTNPTSSSRQPTPPPPPAVKPTSSSVEVIDLVENDDEEAAAPVLAIAPRFTSNNQQHRIINRTTPTTATTTTVAEGSFVKEFQDAIRTITSTLNTKPSRQPTPPPVATPAVVTLTRPNKVVVIDLEEE